MMKSRSSRFSRQSAATVVADEKTSIDYDDMIFTEIGSVPVAQTSSCRNGQSQHTIESTKTLNIAEIGRLMDINRELTQATAIDESNRGFRLLQKFGYRSSQGGLGKLNGGLAIPLTVEKRDATDRAGLGTTEVKKRKFEELKAKGTLQEMERDQIVRIFKTELQVQQRATATQRNLEGARRSVYELDYRSGITDNILWPENVKPDTCIDGTTTSVSSPFPNLTCATQLDECMLYLRETYHFCFFCGIQFDNDEEFERKCPGPHEDDH